MTPKKSAPSKAVAKSRLKVPSTRVDKAPSKALALRAEQPMTTTYGTGSGTITVTVTHPTPHFTGTVTVLGTVVLPFTDGTASVTVPGYALGAIGAAGFEVTIGTQTPAPPYDANLDTLVSPIVSNAASATNAALRAAYVALLPAASGGDDSAALNALLTISGRFRGRPGQTYHLAAPLVLHSGTDLDMTGCTVILIDASATNMVRNYAATHPQRTATVTTAAGSTTVTATGFTSADVGRTILIPGAQGTAFCGQITTTTSSTITVDSAPTTTVTDVTASVYDRDHDITVRGGYWQRGNGGGTGPLAEHMMVFRHVDRLTVRDLTVQETQSGGGKYLINPADVVDFTVENVVVNGQSTSGNGPISIGGPAHRGVIRNVSGFSHDDVVALLGSDSSHLEDMVGDITDVLVDGVHCGAGTWMGAAALTRCAVKIVGGDGTKVRRVVVRNVSGRFFEAAVRIWDDTDFGATDIAGVLVDGVHAIVGEAMGVVQITSSITQDITLRNLSTDGTGMTNPMLIRVDPSYLGVANIGTLVADGLTINGTPINPQFVAVNAPVHIKALMLSRLRFNSPANASGAAVYLVGGSDCQVDRLILSDFVIDKIGNLIDAPTSGSVLTDVQIANGIANGTGALFSGGSGSIGARVAISNVQWLGAFVVTVRTPMDMYLSNVRFTGGGAVFRVQSAGATPVTVQGAGLVAPSGTPGFTRDGAQSVSVRHRSFRCDVSLLTKNDGDEAFNTNAALSCGTGRVISNGTNWKNLYSGATY